MEVSRVSDEILEMNQTQLLKLVDKMNLYWRVNNMIWKKLEELRRYEGSNISKYTKEQIMNMRRKDIPVLLNKLGLWDWVRELLTFTTGTRSWEDYIEPREYRGELVGLIGLLDLGLPVIDTIVSTYDYERIQTICNIISTVTSDSRIWIPSPTRAKLLHLNQILCDSEDFWRLKTEYDFGRPTPTPASYKKFYEEYRFSTDLRRDIISGVPIDWTKASKSPNVTTGLIEFTDKNWRAWRWDFEALSANLAIPLQFIVDHPELGYHGKPPEEREYYPKLSWRWWRVSGRPDVTMEFVMKHPNKPWRWGTLSSKQPLEIISETANDPRYRWNWYIIYNQRLGVQDSEQLIEEYGDDPNLLSHMLFKYARIPNSNSYNIAERQAKHVKELLRHGANPNVIDSSEITSIDTPLIAAVSGGTMNYAAVRELLASGANPNIPDSRRNTALPVAVRNYLYHRPDYDAYAIRMLLEHGANPTIPDDTGRSALDYFRENPGKFSEEVHSLLEPYIS